MALNSCPIAPTDGTGEAWRWFLGMPCLNFPPTRLRGNLNINRLEEMSGRPPFSMKPLFSSCWVPGTVPGPGNTSLTKMCVGYFSCKLMVSEFVEETERILTVCSS